MLESISCLEEIDMSGSGGGRDDYTPPNIPSRPGSGGGGAGGTAGGDPCAIFQQAPLNSPRPGVVPTLNVGDVLGIVLNIAGVRPVLEVHAPAGIAGSLTHTGHVQIIDCIRLGNSYVAEVVGRSGAAVNLQVRPA